MFSHSTSNLSGGSSSLSSKYFIFRCFMEEYIIFRPV